MTRSFTSFSISRKRFAGNRRRIREIEPQPIVIDLRALLLRMATEILLQRVMQDVRRGVGPADAGSPSGIDEGLHLRAGSQIPLRRWPS